VNLLVTGGAGYVGSMAVPLLLEHGHRVRVLDAAVDNGALVSAVAYAGDRLELMAGDVGDRQALGAALEDVEAIVHLAAVVGYPACQREPERAVATNVEGMRTLLALRRSDQRIVYASTGSIYGEVENGVCTEQTPQRPLTLYGKTKAAAEQLLCADGNFISFRYATAFGVSPRMRYELLLNNFIFQAVREGRLTVYQSGSRRTFIHVCDIARSLAFAVDRWDDLADDVYNVGDESLNMSKMEVANRIRDHVDFELRVSENGSDPDKRDYAVSYAKLRSKGFSVSVELDEGIAELVEAARSPKGDRHAREAR
jgi:nucleoside-diphosphate-sugar epimerase